MDFVNAERAQEIRHAYIEAFLHTATAYYKTNIERMEEYEHAWGYQGYLWDCFRVYELISPVRMRELLQATSSLIVFWDIHTAKDKPVLKNRRYPATAMLTVTYDELVRMREDLPEDIYVTDASLSFSVAFTHEENDKGCPLMFYSVPWEVYLTTCVPANPSDVGSVVASSAASARLYVPRTRMYIDAPLEGATVGERYRLSCVYDGAAPCLVCEIVSEE